MPRKLLTIIAVLAAAMLAAPVVATAKDRALRSDECADADLEPAAGNVDRVRAAIVCLHNAVRADHGLPTLREHARLRRAALGHSRNMVGDGFFDHDAPDGATMVDRIIRARYVRRNGSWSLGENIAWGTGSLSTARATMKAWMDSPGHRANILRRGYRELGVGVALGVPVSDAAGATYTVDFGTRR